MKEKIFNALKQEFSYLGLGDALLQAQADTLASLGFVTDENLDAVVKAQETGLRAYQAANDKRVADALAKANASSAKDRENAEKQASELQKQLDDLTRQVENDKSTLAKQSEELAKAQEIQKQLDTLKAQTEKQTADFEKRKKDLLALINGTQPEPQQPAAQPQPEKPKPTEKPQPTFDEAAFRKKLETEWAKKLETIANANGEQFQQILQSNNELTAQVQALVKENAEYKAAKAAENRKNFILSKAKELGIPDWRISEGFSFAENADEGAITNTLTTVSNNIRANMLPQDGINVPLSPNNGTPDKGFFDGIAEKLVQNI